MVSSTRALPKLVVIKVEGGAGHRPPEGVNDLRFLTYEEFSPSPSSDGDLGLWTGI